MFIEPVFGKKFFGREEVLGTLNKRVTALKGGYRQNLALTGPMLAGKSSILRHFLKNLENSDIVPIYIEMGEDGFSVFCTRFMATILYREIMSRGQKCGRDLDTLKNACRDLLPATVRAMEGVSTCLARKKDNRAYEKLLDLPSVYKAETGKNCIVILDEFHNLSNFRLKRPFQTFGKYIMVQKNTMYIVSSSQKTLLKEILSKKLSLLFGNFEVIGVDGFDNQTARSFVLDKLRDVPGGERVMDYLIQISKGNPFYLEVLAGRFSERIKTVGGERSAKECLLDVFAEVLYRSDGVLNQYFSNNVHFFLEKRSRKSYIPVLLSMARGNGTMKDIQADLGKTDKNLSSKLQKLQEMDLVFNSGVFYKISDKLFEQWLRTVYGLKTRSSIDDMDIKYLEFKSLVQKEFESFCEFRTQDIEDVIAGLFRQFNNEKLKICMNSRKMPKFRRVHNTVLRDDIFCLTGDLGGRAWKCHVKKSDRVNEQDICELVAEKGPSDDIRVVRKIYIVLKGIEQNAFLLAKEKNIWIWDISKLNEILRLFGNFELVL